PLLVGQMNFEMSCCSACRLKNGQHMRLPWSIGYSAQQQNKPYHDPIPFEPTYFWVWNFVH
ncbi:hypothetical protein Q7337_09175, partial [Glaesserella parasuis]|nr:hypothetical protein [Glaesserella parasuis]